MENRHVSDIERNNKAAMLCHWIETILIVIAYIYKLSQQSVTPINAIIVCVIALGVVIAESICWKKNHETTMIKHLVGVGFAVLYIYMMFTTNSSATFLYVLPMILAISVFQDAVFAIKINIGAVLVNVIAVIAGIVTGGFGFSNIEFSIIQVIIIALTAIYSVYTSMVMAKNSQAKMDNVKEAHDETERVLGNMSNIYKELQDGITEIHERVGRLEEASNMTKDAMGEVTSGATETADAVQKQLVQTDAIQQKVDMVSDAAIEITERMQQTLEILQNGNVEVDKLVKEVEVSVQNGVEVAEKLETLDKYMSEMNSIVELISGITSQTSLLSLNASIEAARAGEAGRGFSVVATEISAMANQTKGATENIAKLIENVSGAITQVVEVIRNMIDGINEEKQSTENTAKSFAEIEKNTYVVRDNVMRLNDSMEELKAANQDIADSVQTISAITEEVSAHANETMNAEEKNVHNLNVIAQKSEQLLEIAKNQ